MYPTGPTICSTIATAKVVMMASSNGDIFRVTGHLYGEFTGPPVNSPPKGQWHGALMFSLICVWKNSLVNNREAGDLRRHRTHYDVTVMIATSSLSSLAVSTQPEKNGRYFTNHILYVFWDDNGCVFIEKSPECFPLTRIALVHVMACRRTDHCWVNDV